MGYRHGRRKMRPLMCVREEFEGGSGKSGGSCSCSGLAVGRER